MAAEPEYPAFVALNVKLKTPVEMSVGDETRSMMDPAPSVTGQTEMRHSCDLLPVSTPSASRRKTVHALSAPALKGPQQVKSLRQAETGLLFSVLLSLGVARSRCDTEVLDTVLDTVFDAVALSDHDVEAEGDEVLDTVFDTVDDPLEVNESEPDADCALLRSTTDAISSKRARSANGDESESFISILFFLC